MTKEVISSACISLQNMLGAQEKLDDLLPQKNWAKFGGKIFDRKLVDKLYKSFPCKQVQG
jgi:hypothetical protein